MPQWSLRSNSCRRERDILSHRRLGDRAEPVMCLGLWMGNTNEFKPPIQRAVLAGSNAGTPIDGVRVGPQRHYYRDYGSTRLSLLWI